MRLVCLVGFFITSLGLGPRADAFFIGHNMTPTTETLNEHQWTVGTYALAYGLSKTLFIATSPWIWLSYNTANVHLKWVPIDDEVSRFGFFFSYFESYNSAPLDTALSGSVLTCRDRHTCTSTPAGGSPEPLPNGTTIGFGLNRYQWQSTSLHGLYSYRWTPVVETYLSLKLSYFWNDDLPYSIRMDPGSDAIRGQFDFTGLTELTLPDRDFHLAAEIGILGANYRYPYMHIGGSFSYVTPSWLLQLGASYTVQFREAFQSSGWKPGRFDNRLHESKSDGQLYFYRYLQTALHPEIQVQYFF